ncbi:MAG: hypothetical protein ACYS1A_16895 [Planctomycetota bacterium]|jgi:hypothetical protein
MENAERAGIRSVVGCIGKQRHGKTTAADRLTWGKCALIHDPAYQYSQAGLVCESRDAVLNALKNSESVIIYQPGKHDIDDVEWVSYLARSCLYDWVIAFDELDVSLKASPRFEGVEDFAWMITSGRRQMLHVIFTGLRCARLPKDLIFSCTRLLIFNTSEPGDLDYLKSRVSKEELEKIVTLPLYFCLDWREDGLSEIIKNDQVKF